MQFKAVNNKEHQQCLRSEVSFKRMRNGAVFHSCGIALAARGVSVSQQGRVQSSSNSPPFFLSTVFSVRQVPVSPLLWVGAHSCIAALCQPWGRYSVLGLAAKSGSPLNVPGTQPPLSDAVVNDQEIEKVKCTKFLGLYIDNELSWRKHVNRISTKISKMTGIMAKATHVLSIQTLKTIYNTMVYPYLTYCSIIWTSTYPTRLKSIFTIQKKLVQIMTFSNYHENPSLFSNL